MKRSLAALGIIAVVAASSVASAAIPTVRLGSQAWWNIDGLSIPSVHDHHLHVDATIPLPGTIVDGRVDVPVDLTLHNQVGSPNYVRWSDGSSVEGSVPL